MIYRQSLWRIMAR